MELTYYGVNCELSYPTVELTVELSYCGVNCELSYPTVEHRDGWEVSQARL